MCKKPCRECGQTIPSTDYRALFCSPACRKTWNNRRMTRGMDLYDAFMVMRYDRGAAKLYGMWALICRMAYAWNEEDRAAGRKSFAEAKEIVARHAHHNAEVLVKGRR